MVVVEAAGAMAIGVAGEANVAAVVVMVVVVVVVMVAVGEIEEEVIDQPLIKLIPRVI
jgi:hypothetical protein